MTDNDFYHGFAIALGSLARDHGYPRMAVEIMKCNGVELEQLEQSGAEDFDLDPLRKEIYGDQRWLREDRIKILEEKQGVFELTPEEETELRELKREFTRKAP